MFPLNYSQKIVLRLIILNLIFLIVFLIWSFREQQETVDVAVAKGKQMLDMNMVSAPTLDVSLASQLALNSPEFVSQSTRENLEFVNAVLLNSGEARYWQEMGCSEGTCAHVTFYDHAIGGSIEAVVDLKGQRLIGSWTNENARPGGTTWILPRAIEIAASSTEVQSILGDIGNADPAMVPMSGWLADSNCSREWCVDLTFHDPNGSGRIYHVFVNMESDQVERTFYTRGRPERSAALPLAQRNAFSDGCHEQHDWEVCWEMTANDGIDFQDAKYKGQTIFRSAKIGQVEAWYPSWPGGYRDEIGFAASVPPFGDTQINDLGNGFEVRQFFTEFTRWPNCICCYRYEEVLRFFDDGALEFRFLSHGPGCDDLSIYRPFWRVDLDLKDPENDEVWLWDMMEWQEQNVEFEEHPVIDETAPDGQKLATVDGDLHYRWIMEQTDPFGLDEGYLFLLQYKDNEGNGPIVTGPGDTFIPPRQWIDGDELSGENIVLWHVPLLKTVKSDPWWCMPDPEPEFSPCLATLRTEPGAEFTESPPVDLATLAPSQADMPQSDEPTATPLPTPTPAPTSTPRPLEGDTAEEIFLNAGCTSCHQIGHLGESHKVGPDLSNIRLDSQDRVSNMSAEEYIRQSILDPNAYLAPECPNGPCLANIMPRDYQLRLSAKQVDLLVDYLLELERSGLELPDVSTGAARSAAKAFPAPEQAKQARGNEATATTPSVTILVLSLVFLISLLVYFRGKPDKESE